MTSDGHGDLNVLLRAIEVFTQPAGTCRALRELGVDAPLRDYDLVWGARRSKLLPTLASAWVAAGRSVGPALDEEIVEHVRRAGRYALVAERLCARDPDVVVLKGETIARHYPAGWVRRTGDLDVVVPGADAGACVAAELLASGWQPLKVQVLPDEPVQLTVSLLRPDSGSWLLDRDIVQITTLLATGLPYRDSAARLGDSARAVVALADEVVSRPPGARDVLDLLMVWRAMDDADRDAALALVTDARLASPWRQLVEATRKVGGTAPAAQTAVDPAPASARWWRGLPDPSSRSAELRIERGTDGLRLNSPFGSCHLAPIGGSR